MSLDESQQSPLSLQARLVNPASPERQAPRDPRAKTDLSEKRELLEPREMLVPPVSPELEVPLAFLAVPVFLAPRAKGWVSPCGLSGIT